MRTAQTASHHAPTCNSQVRRSLTAIWTLPRDQGPKESTGKAKCVHFVPSVCLLKRWESSQQGSETQFLRDINSSQFLLNLLCVLSAIPLLPQRWGDIMEKNAPEPKLLRLAPWFVIQKEKASFFFHSYNPTQPHQPHIPFTACSTPCCRQSELCHLLHFSLITLNPISPKHHKTKGI